MRIALDAMGSDNYPTPEVEGAVLAVREFGVDVVLTGDEARLRPLIPADLPPGKLTIVHAPEAVAMDEKPAFASRSKSDNSMARGLQLVRDGEADAFITMGNTGAALTNGLFILKRIPGVRRPALTARFPTRKGWVVVLDIGANAECKPEYLLQFAIMGTEASKVMVGVQNPRVALLSNGAEEGKGNDLVIATYPLLKASGLNYVGNIESKAIFHGEADVVVTDGFSGNVFLKTAEAIASYITSMMRESFKQSPLTMMGAALSRPVFNDLKAQLDPAEIGAAPLLGLNGLAMVGHGSSNARAVRSAILQAKQAVEADFIGKLRGEIQAQVQATRAQEVAA